MRARMRVLYERCTSCVGCCLLYGGCTLNTVRVYARCVLYAGVCCPTDVTVVSKFCAPERREVVEPLHDDFDGKAHEDELVEQVEDDVHLRRAHSVAHTSCMRHAKRTSMRRTARKRAAVRARRARARA